MKKSITLLFVIFSYFSATGQITIGSDCIPDVGDVLSYSVIANIEDSINYLNDGEDLTWSYNDLTYDGNIDVAFQDISGTLLADSFPQANAALAFAGFLSIANIMENEVSLIGLAGNPLSFLTGDSSRVLFSEPFTYKKTPINYGDSYEDDFEIVFTFPAEVVPGADSIMLPIPGATLDSARVRILVYKSEEVTAWGTLNLNGKSHEVLKVKQIDTVGTTLEAGISFLGNILWIDASDFVNPGEFGFGLDQNTTTYKFLENNNKEAVLEIRETMIQDSSGNEFIQRSGRVSNSILSDVAEVYKKPIEIDIFPNPSSHKIKVNCTTKMNKVEIYTSNGQLMESIYPLNSFCEVDISNFNEGVYILTIWSNNKKESRTFIKQ
jgi:hypothetical protein